MARTQPRTRDDPRRTPALRGAPRGGALLAILLAPWLCACAPETRLEMISLHAGSIDPPAPQTYDYENGVSRWWETESGELAVTLQFTRDMWFSPYRRVTFDVSFLLDGMPVGQARTYRVTRRETRAVLAAGLEEHRFLSTKGVCKIERADGDRLRGSYRLWMFHQPGPSLFDLFPRNPSLVLFQGRFEALPESNGVGRAVFESTEAHGWHREPKPTPPATAPATAASTESD